MTVLESEAASSSAADGSDVEVAKGRVAEIRIYPVKGLQGYNLSSVHVDQCGLAGDRRWMVIDTSSRYVTQREDPSLATIASRLLGKDAIELRACGLTTVVAIPQMHDVDIVVTMRGVQFFAKLADRDSNEWLSLRLKKDYRLAYLFTAGTGPALSHRCISFADQYPVLLASGASLTAVNDRLSSPISMDRFRPNVVITGFPAWSENGWAAISIGTAAFRVEGRCERCGVICIDQTTGKRDHSSEPLRTLAALRNPSITKVEFGVHLSSSRLGNIRVGDDCFISR